MDVDFVMYQSGRINKWLLTQITCVRTLASMRFIQMFFQEIHWSKFTAAYAACIWPQSVVQDFRVLFQMLQNIEAFLTHRTFVSFFVNMCSSMAFQFTQRTKMLATHAAWMCIAIWIMIHVLVLDELRPSFEPFVAQIAKIQPLFFMCKLMFFEFRWYDKTSIAHFTYITPLRMSLEVQFKKRKSWEMFI